MHLQIGVHSSFDVRWSASSEHDDDAVNGKRKTPASALDNNYPRCHERFLYPFSFSENCKSDSQGVTSKSSQRSSLFRWGSMARAQLNSGEYAVVFYFSGDYERGGKWLGFP